MTVRRPSWVRLNAYSAYRWLEALPGLAIWLTFGLAVLASLVAPLWAIGFIVAFDVFWLVRVVYTMSYLVIAYRQYRRTTVVDWHARLLNQPGWQEITHLIFLPTYGEPYEVLDGTFQSLCRVTYPLKKCLVVLATEGREAERIRPIAHRLQAAYGHRFLEVIVTEHPADIVGEVAGKGANTAWAARQVETRIQALGLKPEHIIVSTFDADSVAHPQYFSYLTVTFLNHPDRLRTSYQPIPLFHNNFWDALPMMRVVAASTTIWLLGDAARPERLLTFSSHSMPYTALREVGYWQTDVVSEDSRISLQCLVRYDGQYAVTPLFLPISMDTIQAPTFWRSVVNQYKQIRRWAYGAENFPYMVWNFLTNKHMPRLQAWRYIWNQFEGTFSWSTAPILITLLGWLPYRFHSEILDTSVLAHNAPLVTQRLLLGAMVGLVISAAVTTAMIPRHHAVRWYQWIIVVGQWLLLPVTMIVFGSIPAIEAQTRLMFGRYLGFWVSEKSRRA